MRSQIANRGWKTPVLALLVALFAWSCCPPSPEIWWSESSPDGRWRVAVGIDSAGIGGSTWLVYLFPGEEDLPLNAERDKRIYSIHGCVVQYVFWLDNDTLEILLPPSGDSCKLENGKLYPAKGIEILIRTLEDTSKLSVLATSRLYPADA